MNTPKFRSLLLVVCAIMYCSFSIAQKNTRYDHVSNVDKVKNSSHTTYLFVLKQYNDYLRKYPRDIEVTIERCKFIANAELDEYEENPNYNYFDSCFQLLKKDFPNNPKAFLYISNNSWGDSLALVFDKAKASIEESPDSWTDSLKAAMYFEIAYYDYRNEEYENALKYINKAAELEDFYEGAWLRARLYADKDKRAKALTILNLNKDTSSWMISSKAELFLELKSYEKALEFFSIVREKDSTYIDNVELAYSLEGIGKYDEARTYLVNDTIDSYDTGGALYEIFKHDLKFGDKAAAKESYNAFRDYGWELDPLGLYRIELLFHHPFLSWSFRDIFSVLLLVLCFIVLCLIPLGWILPVYVIGHKWKIISKETCENSYWGLKSCWCLAAGSICAMFLCLFNDMEYLNAVISFEDYNSDYDVAAEGCSVLIYLLIFSTVVLLLCRKKHLPIIGPNKWSWGESMLYAFMYFLLFKVIIGVYYYILINGFGFSADEIYTTSNIFMSNREDIDALVLTYGPWIGVLLVVILIPVVEEIAFRGIYLDGIKKYLRFPIANFSQAFLFAAAHWSLLLFPVFLIFGWLCGRMRKQSDGLWAGIFFHIFNNLIAMTALLNQLPN